MHGVRIGAHAPIGAVELCYRGKIICVELQRERVIIVVKVSFACRLRDGAHPHREMPTQHHLSRRAAMFLRNLQDQWIVKKRADGACAATSERAPGLRHDAMTSVELMELALLKIRMDLDLVHRRDDLRLLDQLLEMSNLEVADPDGTDKPGLLEFDQHTPGFDVETQRRTGPVHQIEIELVQPQAFETSLQRRTRFVGALVRIPELAGDEGFAAIDAETSYRIAGLRSRARTSSPS